MNINFTVHGYCSLQSSSESVSGPFGVRFEFLLKCWMRDWVPELLERFHSSWITELTSTSPCLVPVLFLL